MDLFGHVNNVNYFKYTQAARVNSWEEMGLNLLHKETKTGPILASASCQFKRPLFYPGNIIVETKVEFIKSTSFGIAHRIIDANGQIAAEANDVVVFYDFNKNEKVVIPDYLREILER